MGMNGVLFEYTEMELWIAGTEKVVAIAKKILRCEKQWNIMMMRK